MSALTTSPKKATLPLAGWARQVLAVGGINNPSPVAVTGLALWGQSEGLPNTTNHLDIEDVNGDYGKLSRTNIGFGAGRWNKQGVVIYSSESEGAAATARFLKSQYPQIWASLAGTNTSLAQIYRSIQASHFCGYPNCAKTNGASYPALLAESLGISSALPNQGTLSTAQKNAAASSGTGCSAQGDVFGYGGVAGVGGFHITHCELKALTGGLLVVAGGLIMVVGLGVLGLGGGRAQKAAQVATGRTPAAIATNAVAKTRSGRRARAATAPPARPPKPAAKPETPKAPGTRSQPPRGDAELTDAQKRQLIRDNRHQVRAA